MRKILLALSILIGLAAPARAAENYLACQVSGIVTSCPDDARLKAGKVLSLAYIPNLDIAHLPVGTSGSTVAVGNDARFNPAPAAAGRMVYDNGSAWTALAAGTANMLLQANGAGAPSWVSSLTGVTISGALNTLTNIGNSSLTNSSITLSCTGLSGCGAVSLGSTLSPAVSYGSTANTAVQGNDTRVPAAPAGAGGTLYDNGSAWVRLAAGTANYLYQANGAGAPSWVNSLTGISISGSSNTLSNIGNASLTNSSITLTCTGLSGCGAVSLGGSLSPAVSYGTTSGTATQGNDTRLPPTPSGAGKIIYDNGSVYVAASAGTAGQVATSNGATVSFQNPITGTTAMSSLAASPYSLTTTNYEYIELAVSLPSAGTYQIWSDVRQTLQVSASPNGFITCKFYNSTDAADVANSFRLGAVATGTGVVFTGTWHAQEIVTVAAAKTIQTHCKRSAGPTYTTSQIQSDSDGYTRMGYVKLSP